MRVLFSAETPLSLTSYLSVIEELGARDHQVVVAVHEERDVAWLGRLLTEVDQAHVTVERAAGRVLLYEVYDDEAAFEAHLKTPHLAAFRAGI